jgi:predicted enzyme related to lactoylglutathione lyase
VKVTAPAVSLNVEDVAASSRFLQQHFGFAEVMAADGFASLARHDIGMNVVYLRRGLPALPGDQRDVHATGLILVFAVEGLESELARLQAEGVQVTMPLTCEERGSGPSRSATQMASSSSSPTGTRRPPTVSRP